MSEIVNIKLSAIDPNPLRQLAIYPYNADKLGALDRSIREVGLWEGVIGRPSGNRVEIAFGHHRCEAARQVFGNDAEIPVIVRRLTDEEMLKFMGRENMEDYNSDFLILLETWEAGEHFIARESAHSAKPTEIARLLGWTREQPGRDADRLNEAATACASASELLQGGYYKRKDLAGLTVTAARDILQSVISNHRSIEKMAPLTGRTADEVKEAKRIAAKAGIATAMDVRAGTVAARDVRGRVGVHSYRIGKSAQRQTPLFEVFAKSLLEQIARVAATDSIADKLNDIFSSLGDIQLQEDAQTLVRVAYECGEAGKRFERWGRRLVLPKKKTVVPLKQIGAK